MKLIEILIIAISLSMDAFAASICKGLATNNASKNKDSIIVSLYFAIFQAFMPLIGYKFGSLMHGIEKIDHFIALILLLIIGISMIYESMEKKKLDNNTDFKTMLFLSVATSIDALIVGITFSFLDVNIYKSILIIGLITFIMSYIGVKIGNKIGIKYGNISELIGGIILILMGIHILLEHLNVL